VNKLTGREAYYVNGFAYPESTDIRMDYTQVFGLTGGLVHGAYSEVRAHIHRAGAEATGMPVSDLWR
jgi:hypothetical protein